MQGVVFRGRIFQFSVFPGQQFSLGPSELQISLFQLVDLLLVPFVLTPLLL
jgi:hypothetical protein